MIEKVVAHATLTRIATVVITSFLTIGLIHAPTGRLHSEADTRYVEGDYDLIIYGGTPSGVTAAIAASSSLKRILLISERPTIGGAISNGLGAVDIGARFAVTGIARDFFSRVEHHYGDHTMWRTEPHVAEAIFREMLAQTQVQLATRRTLTSVNVEHGEIQCLTLDYVDRACARVFIDASYTGDVLAESGAKNILGPTDLYAHDEPEAKRRHFAVMGDFRDFSVGQVQTAIRELPYVQHSATLPYLEGSLKHAAPSWTYRLCITKGNKRAFAPSPEYAKYLKAWRILIKAQYAKGLCRLTCGVKSNGTIQTILWQIVRLPHGKFDLNAGTAQLSNFPMAHEYFSDPTSRAGYERQLQRYLESFLYFAQNDPQVPIFERKAIAGFGLCADEFTDNNNWPYAPYVREGRRLVGASTLTTKNIFHKRVHRHSIAIGSYPMDTKSSQIVYWKGKVFRDVGTFLKAPIYEIPFATMVPAHGPNNLLTSVNISSSPTAFGSVRMEAQYMQLGQSAGTAAALAIQKRIPISKVSVPTLRSTLQKLGVVTSIEELCRDMKNNSRRAQAFDTQTCEALTYSQETPYDDLYGKLTR